MTPEQRKIIVNWLKDGFMDSEVLHGLKKPDGRKFTREEAEFQAKRFAEAEYAKYCPLMKDLGLCGLHGQCHSKD